MDALPDGAFACLRSERLRPTPLAIKYKKSMGYDKTPANPQAMRVWALKKDYNRFWPQIYSLTLTSYSSSCLMGTMNKFDDETVKGVARHTRGMLKTLKRGKKDVRELAYAATAAKLVARLLDEACQNAGIPETVTAAGDEIAGGLDAVMELLGPGWRGR